jgi:hypothetical protein
MGRSNDINGRRETNALPLRKVTTRYAVPSRMILDESHAGRPRLFTCLQWRVILECEHVLPNVLAERKRVRCYQCGPKAVA